MSEPWSLSAAQLSALVRSKQLSAVEAVDSALARLTAVNPAINAVVTEMPEEARAEAARLDAALARGEDPGVLAGVPVTVKVNVDQAGHATTNGLRLQRDLVASVDSPVVANLRNAGAIIIGRTNTPAFSLRWFCRNTLHGRTRNPRSPARTPGGSSGGAAAAIAAGIGAIAHGTDIAGSIRYPAYACGVHGLRPSLGRVPSINFTAPDRYIGPQLMAVSGPIARTVGDLRLGLAAMAQRDVRDPWWMPVPLTLPVGEKRAALCVAPEGLAVSKEVEAALLDAAARLRDAGWEVEEASCPPLREPAHLQLRLWLADYRRGVEEAVLEEADPDACFVLEQLQAHCAAPDLDAVMDTLQRRATLCREWFEFLERYPLLLCPVSAELPFPDLLDVESPAAFSRVLEAQLTQVGLPFMGLPGLVVSTRDAGDTTLGVQLVAGRFCEETLLQAGEAIERAGTPASPVEPRS